jgi:two-component system sensor histidine kinase UhpB
MNKMSLRFQINLHVLFSSLFILLLGGAITIWHAKNATEEEVSSSISMAKQLIKLGFSQSPKIELNESDWLPLTSLEETRHLSIQLKTPSGTTLKFPPKKQPPKQQQLPPQWFVSLVSGNYATAEHKITTKDGQQHTFVIKADPLDEMTEVWQESITFFGILCLLILFTFLAINLAFNKALKSIAVIVESLKAIETGQYEQKLPEFSTTEYTNIAKAINHMTDVMAKTQQQNRALTQHSLEIQEEERQRLSQELHDELGQSLTAIKVLAVTANHEKSNTTEITASISQVCDHLISVVRNMMHQLHPLILTDLGLKAALEDIVNQWSDRSPDISIVMDCTDEVNQLENKITIQIFRVIQECLTNISRHAKAKQVKINIFYKQDQQKMLHIIVADDGVGCDVETHSSGFGLRSMQERIKTLGGELHIQSEPNKGMTIMAKIPVSTSHKNDGIQRV